MKISKSKAISIIKDLIIMIVSFAYIIVDNFIIKNFILGIFAVLILLYAIYLALKNRPLTKEDKFDLIMTVVFSSIVFIYVAYKIITQNSKINLTTIVAFLVCIFFYIGVKIRRSIKK